MNANEVLPADETTGSSFRFRFDWGGVVSLPWEDAIVSGVVARNLINSRSQSIPEFFFETAIFAADLVLNKAALEMSIGRSGPARNSILKRWFFDASTLGDALMMTVKLALISCGGSPNMAAVAYRNAIKRILIAFPSAAAGIAEIESVRLNEVILLPTVKSGIWKL